MNKSPKAHPPAPGSRPPRESSIARSHLKLGWSGLLVFLSLGLALEILHGLKLQSYLDASHETRRLMWTLAHTHGTLLGLVQIAFAFTLGWLGDWDDRSRLIASRSLHAAALLMPTGFFLGGLFLHGGDPGIGVILVTPGALLLMLSVWLTARRAWKS